MTATISCKSFRVRGEADGRVTLEIEDAAPASLLPRLLKRADAAAMLAVSPRHLDALLRKARVRPVASLPVRYREADLLPLTASAAAPVLATLRRSAPKAASASVAPKPAAPPAKSPPAETTRRRIRLHV